MLGLTVLSYLVLRYSAKLIEAFPVPFTVPFVVFGLLKCQNEKLFYNYFVNVLVIGFHSTVTETITVFIHLFSSSQVGAIFQANFSTMGKI